MSKYRCGWGCTTYNPSCDACDGEVSMENSPIYGCGPKDIEKAVKRASRGLDPWKVEEDEEEEYE